MKKLCKKLVIGGALTGMLIGAAAACLTAATLKEKICVGDVVRSKAKEALKGLVK